MVVWHSFLPFGLSIAICVFVSWKSVESQLELRNDGSRRGISEGLGDDDDDDEGAAANAAAPSRHRHRRDHHHRPPRTASELRARLHTLSRMAPGPRRLARGRALALAAERALREASPATTEGGAGGEESDGDLVVVESNAAAALQSGAENRVTRGGIDIQRRAERLCLRWRQPLIIDALQPVRMHMALEHLLVMVSMRQHEYAARRVHDVVVEVLRQFFPYFQRMLI